MIKNTHSKTIVNYQTTTIIYDKQNNLLETIELQRKNFFILKMKINYLMSIKSVTKLISYYLCNK